MKPKLRILHLEDNQADCDLIHQMLVNDGVDCHVSHCDNREAFLDKLADKDFDLIFADCTLPDFSGFHALELAKEQAPEIPFIFVSGSIGEELAIESLRQGATDYVLKDRLSRLVPAVRRAMAEAHEKQRSHEMEKQLRQSQRLEAVGTLAGGVAHDFNNILTIIKGHLSLLELEAGKPERVREIAATLDRASRRGSELVSQLLAFARKSEGSFSATNLNQRVREITSMLREAISRNVIFELQLEEHLPDIHADPSQVDRVLINLATNARDAMPDGGKITFFTHQLAQDKVPFLAAEGVDRYLCLAVTDTGTGMDEETRQHIFEPFFTTKAKGQGTGLGMPVVYGLMQAHNGVIDIQSELGQGTTVSLYFPLPRTRPEAAVSTPQATTKPAQGTETVLVVDDEIDVSYFIEIILKSNGYRVLLSPDAETALDVLKDNESIALLFTDLGLPKLDGFALCQQAKQLRPHLKTILTSGYSDALNKTRMSEAGIDGYITKPYDVSVLLQTFRTVLDRARA